MNLGEAKRLAPGTRRKRVHRRGRGSASGTGKTAGRGAKGQRSRSGFARRRPFMGGQMPMFRQMPKRGFNNARFARSFAVLNLSVLEGVPAGTEVTSEFLRERKLVRDGLPVKLLGDGEVGVALKVRVEACSASARAKIEAAGGTLEIAGAAPHAKAAPRAGA
ncbi:MAG: 50S ribosomal protein L15 [Planctomycetes bacterium]|nr:50S ribosomal protein L15 [Planctomycetota bacterium]